jgi:hypothetical protein
MVPGAGVLVLPYGTLVTTASIAARRASQWAGPVVHYRDSRERLKGTVIAMDCPRWYVKVRLPAFATDARGVFEIPAAISLRQSAVHPLR